MPVPVADGLQLLIRRCDRLHVSELGGIGGD